MLDWTPVLVIGLIVAAAAAFLYGVHRALRWAERRGYIYYLEKSPRPPPSLGLLEQIYEPSIEHVIEEEASEFVRAEEDESGRE